MKPNERRPGNAHAITKSSQNEPHQRHLSASTINTDHKQKKKMQTQIDTKRETKIGKKGNIYKKKIMNE